MPRPGRGTPGLYWGERGSAASSGAEEAAEQGKEADLDGNGRPAGAYQQVLDALPPRCTEDRPRLTAVVNATREDLKKNGVDDEDEFSVLQHLEQSVPAGNPRVNCASVAAAYATQRERNQRARPGGGSPGSANGPVQQYQAVDEGGDVLVQGVDRRL